MIAAFLWAQLENAQEIINNRTTSFDAYYEQLKPLEESGKLRLPYIPYDHTANGHIFYLITNSHEEQEKLLKHLKENGIMAIFHYVPLHSSPAGKKYGRFDSPLINTDTLSQQIIRLPLYYDLDENDIQTVVECIKEFYEG